MSAERSDRFECGDAEGLCDNSLDAYVSNGQLHLSIENPWAGDTETGFGYTTHIELTAAESRNFCEWLNRWRHLFESTP
jgi:hypothetical protein